ncbi:MAG: winged helix-turn-helix domain-containing protein [Colwellia sp.]|nr:winged helix-turn-helix domain-containing protein [Colwellia sp.]
MSVYQFYEFEFNSEKYQLTKNDIRVNIRPKTALVLNYLIEKRQAIVSKNDLFEAVWQTTHVQNHTLFQVISEIRKLTNKDLIRTQPNQGYQWLAPTSLVAAEQHLGVTPSKPSAMVTPISRSITKYLTIAASVAMLSGSSFYLGQWASQKHTLPAEEFSSLPAINAYAKGIMAFDAGQYDQANQWFDFSLLEDPSSVQSELMLAESLFKQQNYNRAQAIAFKLLASVDKSSYHYSSTADLMSRIYAQQGLVFDALAYAISGANSLANSRSFCSIDYSEQRIEKLAQLLIDDKSLKADKEKLLAGYYKKAQQGRHTSTAAESNMSEYRTLCKQVNELPEKRHEAIDLASVCVKPEASQWLLSSHHNSSYNRNRNYLTV